MPSLRATCEMIAVAAYLIFGVFFMSLLNDNSE